jgi:hypothetical protein
MFDISTLVVGTVPLIAVVFGLVEFSKALGLKGKALTIVSLLLGLLFGLAFSFATKGVPVLFAGWFEAVVFGLAIGLVASGFYDFANSRWPKIDKPPF